MAPRKRTSSASKKSLSNQSNQHQQSQPSKFGIQHFFGRHTQNQSQQSKKPLKPLDTADSDTSLPPSQNPQFASAVRNHSNGSPRNDAVVAEKKYSGDSVSVAQDAGNPDYLHGCDAKNANLCGGNSRDDLNSEVSYVETLGNEDNLKAKKSNNPSQITPTEKQFPVAHNVDGNQLEVSPEVCEGKHAKRFKFSPGMLIKQSQDDGGEEITWRISPVNERLHAVSKHLPDVVKVLADSSRFNSLNFKQCSQKKCSPGAAGKLEKWLSSPPLKTGAISSKCSDRVHCTKFDTKNIVCTLENSGSRCSKNGSQSPFMTPPSLSYCHDKPEDSDGVRTASDQLGLRLHKKALIELLDQVEDVISVEESVSDETEAHTEIKKSNKSASALKTLLTNAKATDKNEVSNLYFLVLEVSEKHGYLDSFGSQSSFKIMRLLNEQTGEERIVQLWDEWIYSIVGPGDTVHIIGEFDSQGKCDVNHDKNFLIVHPDILVSGTRVAASFSCSRRAVLDERLKRSEYSATAVIGTLLHQIFQAGLIGESLSKEFLEEYARVVLQKNLETLYACGVNENDTLKTLTEAIPKIINWISLFRDLQGSRIHGVDFGCNGSVKKINIHEVVDIEEMAWAPKFGLKGMIDASICVKVEAENNKTSMQIMPLEFKTGKGTKGQTAMEHSAQVMLYTLLMSERYKHDIDNGLLYYLQTDHTQGITVHRSDLVGLIIRRNELANDLLKASMTQQLPPMLQSLNLCRSCHHLDVCTIYHKAYGGTMEGSGLGNLFDSLVQHLTNEDTNFLQIWNRLIDLEAKELEITKKRIWTSQILKNDDNSSSLSSLVLDMSQNVSPTGFSKGNPFVYRFIQQDSPLQSSSSGSSKFNCTLRTGDYVILSSESGHLPVARGILVDVGSFHVLVSFSKRLRLPGSISASGVRDLSKHAWRIDKDEAMASFAIMRFNIVQLFLQNEQTAHLRKMIVDLEMPRFDSGCVLSQDPAISYIWSEKTLNDDQRRAILKILTAKDYALILGMPGTGKTSTMVHAVKALLLRGASILLTSYTNSAVDNLLIKLKAQGINFIRIGRCEAVHDEIRENCLSEMNMRSIEEIKVTLDQTRVIAVTCLGISSPLLANKRFDICIMDEAGQTTLPVSLGPLMLASKFVLVGDHYQLPPLVQSIEAKENGMAVSLFCRLSEAHPQAISALQSQYRMCAAIMQLSNALIYGNRLRCGSPEIENAKIAYTVAASSPEWLKQVLCPDRPVIFINTDLLPALETHDCKTVNNPVEAYIITAVVNKLVDRGVEGADIGIITPYNSQASLIRDAVSASVEIHTIDKYQGRDKDCILVSFVRSTETPRNCSSSLLGDWHRINVAITRAKKKLIMVGSCRTLSTVPLLKLLIDEVEEQSGILNISKKDINLKQLTDAPKEDKLKFFILSS